MFRARQPFRWVVFSGLLLLLFGVIGTPSARAAGVVGTGTPASCTEVAFDAARAGGGLVSFNCGPNPVTITLSALKAITTNTTINGGNRITLKAQNTNHFQVQNAATLVLKNIVISGGSANAAGAIENFGTTKTQGVTFKNNKSFDQGGAIANYGTLKVKKSVFNNNQAATGGGAIWNDGGNATLKASQFLNNKVTNSGGQGGAAANKAGDVKLINSTLKDNVAVDGGAMWTEYGSTNTIKNSTFDHNTASGVGGNGGALENFGGIEIRNSKFTDNEAGNVGGGISHGGSMSMYNSTISGNHAGSGGGMRDFGNSTFISGSTFSGNTATSNGGGIYSSGSPTVVNSTLSGNQAGLLANGGGGWYQRYGHSFLLFVTIANNKASYGAGAAADGSVSSQIDFQNTVLSKNNGGNCAGATLVSLGHNLSSDTYCGSFTNTGDKTNKSAKLGPLANNGGPTMTHLPLAGSRLINKGINAQTATDQRGLPRPVGSKPDIGAVEVQ